MSQHQALANLHKVVQICNSGLNIDAVKTNVLERKNINSNSSIGHNYKTIESNNININSGAIVGLPAFTDRDLKLKKQNFS